MRRRSFLRSHQTLLDRRPLVVGTIAGPQSVTAQISVARRLRPDLIEIRLDTLLLQDFHHIRQQTKLPILLTIRSPQEGGGMAGGRDFSETDRLSLFRLLLPFCDLIDLELRHPSLIKALAPQARRLDVDVLHSAHDFSGIGSAAKWKAAAERSRRWGGDLFKLAVTPRNDVEMESFLRWGQALGHPRPVLIGMGQAGLISRFAGFTFGSCLAYGHLGRAAAPGQPAVADLLKTTRGIYGSARS